MNSVSPLGPAPAIGRPTASDGELRKAAIALEASFLAEMLRFTGLSKAPDSFGGGAGESQFSSFLVRAQAEQIARSGGVGLAETFFNALKEKQDGN
jgi:peptidoglycan hydrolase FlgJ